MTTITKNDLKELITIKTAQYIAKGYNISEGYTSNDLPQIELIKGKNTATISSKNVYASFSDDDDSFDGLKLIVSENKEEVEVTNFYRAKRLYDNVYYATRDEAAQMNELHASRFSARRVNDEREINVTRDNVKFLRNISGWKSVPMKNIRVIRDNSGYTLSNVTNDHTTTIKTR